MARYGFQLASGRSRLDLHFNGTPRFSANATGLSFYNVAPVARAGAYTQTYATADKTHADVTQVTPPAGGTGATVGAYDTAANRDAMITSITAGAADLLDLKQLVNAIIDDLQAYGLMQ